MLKRVQRFIYPKLAGKSFESDNELYLYLILIVATIFSMLFHVMLLGIYIITNTSLLIIFNIFSLIFSSYCITLIKKKNYKWSGTLLSVDVILYSLASCYVIGVDNYTILYLFIILIMQLIIPYANYKIRGTIIVAVWIGVIIIILLGIFHEPLLPSDGFKLFLSIANIHLGFIGTAFEVVIGNVIREVIAGYNEKRVEELEAQAYTDALTGLYNRRYADLFFNDVKTDRPVLSWCVAIMDIDDFKNVNDTWGHSAGDTVLRTVSKIMKKNLRKTDLLIRWGGEEFLLFLENVDEEEAYNLLEKLRKTLKDARIHVNSDVIRFTVTIGAEMLDIENLPMSIENCDKKLYIGKNSGKDKVVI